MNRGHVLKGFGAAGALAGSPLTAFAGSFSIGTRTTTQSALFAVLPRPKSGQWVRLILGSGVDYQKQIGAASESTEHGDLLYYETQVGTPGGSCNPNTMKRTYLRGSTFASLFAQTQVLADVANSGTTLTRWSDIEGGQTQERMDSRLQLLDAAYLYDDRPMRVVSVSQETLQLPASSAYSGSADSNRGALHPYRTTHTVAEFSAPYDRKHKLTRVEFWTTPDVPFGIAKYRAIGKGVEPFELRLYSFGTGFKTDLAMSLQTIRAVTPDGTFVRTS